MLKKTDELIIDVLEDILKLCKKHLDNHQAEEKPVKTHIEDTSTATKTPHKILEN